jgi:NADH-quinone oxidoreductase subunit N
VNPWVFLPEVVVLAGALLILLLDVLGERRVELLGGIAVLSAGLSFTMVLADLGYGPLAVLQTLPSSLLNATPTGPSYPLYQFTSLGLVFQSIFLIAAFLVALASLSHPSEERGAAVFFGLLLIATLGMMLVAIAADLIFLLVAIEVTGIATYLMTSYTRKDPRGVEAAMKFFIVGALSTSLSFFGASLLFGAYHGTSFYVLSQAAGPVGFPALALLGYALLIAGLGFKVTAVPFHAWAVDVYDGAPTDVSAFLAGGSKKMGIFAFFLVFLGPVLALGPGRAASAVAGSYSFAPSIQLTIAVVAVLTMTVGNVLALLQKEMKRMLAYSSISQAGYMLIGVAVGTGPAITGATFQVFAHVFMKTGAFLVVAAVASLGVGPLIEDWAGLGQRRPYLSLAFALMLLSLAGIPLTIGFVSKFVLFAAAVQAQQLFVWLAVAGLLNSALSAFYYARVLKVMYMDPPPRARAPSGAPDGGAMAAAPLAVDGLGYGRAAAILLIAVAIVAIGVYPQPVLGPIHAAATHFVAVGA